MLRLPENFESYSEARQAGFLKMKELKEKGGVQNQYHPGR